jgi:hypothetical protein
MIKRAKFPAVEFQIPLKHRVSTKALKIGLKRTRSDT